MASPKATAGANNATTTGEAPTKNPICGEKRKLKARWAVGGKAPRKLLGKPAVKSTKEESESESEEEEVVDVLIKAMTTQSVTGGEEEGPKVSTEHVLYASDNG